MINNTAAHNQKTTRVRLRIFLLPILANVSSDFLGRANGKHCTPVSTAREHISANVPFGVSFQMHPQGVAAVDAHGAIQISVAPSLSQFTEQPFVVKKARTAKVRAFHC